MATEKNIVMKEFNGTDYDTLYPKTIGTQVDGIFTAEQTLTNNTKALYGLGTDAVPDDVFAWLGKYNQYWWEKIVTATKYRIASETYSSGYVRFASSGGTLYKGTGVLIDENTGEITLANQQVASSREAVDGTYYMSHDGAITNGTDISGTPITVPIKLDNTTTWGTASGKVYYKKYATTYSAEAYTIKERDSFVQSQNYDAYPHNDSQDGFFYSFCGVPFENAVLSRTEYGSYIGTGSNQTLVLPFAPKILMINNEPATFTVSGTSVTITSHKTSQTVYDYFAIG